ncbi:hypothetical protein QI30_19305 [Kurthia sp. 3B1D]|uniref:Uncharacterized protein n=1 Tax=Candidatus Kurthia intestinigallinarum TaxID=1562256 RepID=A0A433RNZ4_9BACL|nr:hypothetical protein QI30_20155 [Kurthia sp. 3B1D]RUS50415.1 hypothetical protein QI30_19305 [Kurthia sp. 3B1D]
MSILKRKKSFLLCKGGKVEICNFYSKSTFSQKWKSRKVRENIRVSMLFMSLQPSYFMFYLVVIKILGKIKSHSSFVFGRTRNDSNKEQLNK